MSLTVTITVHYTCSQNLTSILWKNQHQATLGSGLSIASTAPILSLLLQVSTELGMTKYVRWLDLSHNDITWLPNEFCAFGYALDEFHMRHNRLQTLPQNISQLQVNRLYSPASHHAVSTSRKYQCLIVGIAVPDVWVDYWSFWMPVIIYMYTYASLSRNSTRVFTCEICTTTVPIFVPNARDSDSYRGTVFHLVQFLLKSLIISHYWNTTIIVLFTYELQSGLKAVHFTKMCTTILKNNLFKIKTCTVVTVDVTVTGLFQIYSR